MSPTPLPPNSPTLSCQYLTPMDYTQPFPISTIAKWARTKKASQRVHSPLPRISQNSLKIALLSMHYVMEHLYVGTYHITSRYPHEPWLSESLNTSSNSLSWYLAKPHSFPFNKAYIYLKTIKPLSGCQCHINVPSKQSVHYRNIILWFIGRWN